MMWIEFWDIDPQAERVRYDRAYAAMKSIAEHKGKRIKLQDFVLGQSGTTARKKVAVGCRVTQEMNDAIMRKFDRYASAKG